MCPSNGMINSVSTHKTIIESEHVRYDYSVLSPRGLLGYNYEVCVQWLLDKNGIKSEPNPLDPIEWNKQWRCGADKLITVGNVHIDAECKFHSETSRPIFPCDIEEDYLTRFVNPSHVKVVVTNDKSFYSEGSVKLLTDNGILLLTDDELITFCLRLNDYSPGMTVGSINDIIGSITSVGSDYDVVIGSVSVVSGESVVIEDNESVVNGQSVVNETCFWGRG